MHFFLAVQGHGFIYIYVVFNWQQKLNKKFVFFTKSSDSVSDGCALMYGTMFMCLESS